LPPFFTGGTGGKILSIQAVAWAIEQQQVKEPMTRFVLICLANYAGMDGRAAFPSLMRLSLDTGLSERAVRYQLRRLEKAILIRPGNQAIAVAQIKRADRRPTVYDMVMERGAPDAPRKLAGGTTQSNGGQENAKRGAPHAPNPEEGTVRDPLQDFVEDFKSRFGKIPQ
jgi:hypothetical protein